MSADPITPAEQPHLTLRVLDTWEAAPAYTALRLERPEGFGYTTPGQYIALTTGQLTPRYFALAGPVDAPWLELLLKREGDTALVLTALQPGDTVTTTLALGRGFNLKAMQGRHLVLFASGAGIAPLLPLLAFWQRSPEPLLLQSIWLYYGSTSADDFAYPDAIGAAEAAGAHIYRASSATPDRTAGFVFVQDAFAHHAPPLDQSTVVLCGSPPMESAVEAALRERGFDTLQILRNY